MLCGLSAGRKNIVFGEGNPEAMLVFVGEAPGQEEENLKRPLAGPAGDLLTDIIVKGMKLKLEDVYICNILKCRPPAHRKPGPDEINACEAVLARQIEAIGPKVIVALGGTAASSLLKTSEGITTIRGQWQSYNGIPVMPTFHPAHLLKKESDKKLVWEDIKKVMAKLEKVKKG
jgi:DNA polymerase